MQEMRDWVYYKIEVGQAPRALPFEKNNIVILSVGENLYTCSSSNFQEWPYANFHFTSYF